MTYTKENQANRRRHGQDEFIRIFGDLVQRPIIDIVQKGGMILKQPILANVYEKENQYELHLTIPGFNKEEIGISIDDRKLTIKADQVVTKDEEGKTHLQEWKKSSFSKVYTLPKDANVEMLSAKYDAGILSITVAKVEKPKPQKITVE